LTPNEKLSEMFPDYFDAVVREKVSMLKKINAMHRELAETKIATYFIRYEDLRQQPIRPLEELFSFLLDSPSIEGTVIQQRISEVAAAGS